jgi:hypothetical protein
MSEMQRMLRAGGGSGAVALPESVDQAPAVVATLHRPDGAAVARVRRILFEPVDHEDTRQFVEHELALQQERDSERWGFDFLHEKERSSGPGSKRYVWEKVTPQEKIPEPYALRGMEYLSKCAVDGDDAPAPAAATTVASGETTKKTKQTSISGTELIPLLQFDKSLSCQSILSLASSEVAMCHMFSVVGEFFGFVNAVYLYV